MNDFCQVHTAKDRLHPGNIKALVLFEDHHFRMIVKRECLFRRLVVDHDRPELWIRFEYGNQVKPELPLKDAWLRDTIAPNDLLIVRAADQFAIVHRC